MLTKVQHLTQSSRRDWSADPAARGAAKVTAGTALVAEALLGLRSRAAAAMWPDEEDLGRTHGITGPVVGLVLGVVLVVLGLWVAPAPSPDELTADGVIVGVEGAGVDGEVAYTPVIEFTDADGQVHRFTPGYSQSDVPSVGGEVTVGYLAHDPAATARRTDGIAARLHWLLLGTGIVIGLLSVVDLAIRLVMVALGLRLIRSGRADRAAAGTPSTGLLPDLIRLVRSPEDLSGPADRTPPPAA